MSKAVGFFSISFRRVSSTSSMCATLRRRPTLALASSRMDQCDAIANGYSTRLEGDALNATHRSSSPCRGCIRQSLQHSSCLQSVWLRQQTECRENERFAPWKRLLRTYRRTPGSRAAEPPKRRPTRQSRWSSVAAPSPSPLQPTDRKRPHRRFRTPSPLHLRSGRKGSVFGHDDSGKARQRHWAVSLVTMTVETQGKGTWQCLWPR